VYGAGCGNPALALTTTAPPIIGTTAKLTLGNAPSSVAFIAGGLSNTRWGTVPLPFSLTTLGMPGCELLQSAEEVGLLMTSVGTGTATFDWPLPNQISIIGERVYLQSWALAPGQNAANVTLSNGVEWLVGNF